MPRKLLDTRENLPKERQRQVASTSCKMKYRACRDEAAAGLEQPLVQARQRPTLDGTGEGESNRRRRLLRLYAMTRKSSRTSLAR